MKIIAFYLPQFHEIPENNKWWGDGFTEWVNVRKAKPLFPGHSQPRVPLNLNFYDLSDNSVMSWQIALAKKYGLYGFCFYHYWFAGHLLLQKPIEDFLNNKDQDFPFCICWANEHWTNAWVSSKNKVLIEQNYGGKNEWKAHFDYLLPFFKDDRYIKENNKPLLVIYRPEIIGCLNEMLDYWNQLAYEHGFDGFTFAYQHIGFDLMKEKDDSLFTYNIEYQPTYAQTLLRQKSHQHLRLIWRKVSKFLENRLRIDLRFIHSQQLIHFDYEKIWDFIINMEPVSSKSVPGAFVDWDNTPRRGRKGIVYSGATPEKFKRYLSLQINRAKSVYKSEYIFLFSWNEWAEGGYLEPDEKNGFGYLEALKAAIEGYFDCPEF